MKRIMPLAFLCLSFAGCNSSQKLEGDFRGGKARIEFYNENFERKITIMEHSSYYPYNLIILNAKDGGRGIFSDIVLEGQDISVWKFYEEQGMDYSSHSLYRYANPDSLEHAFQEVIGQNR